MQIFFGADTVRREIFFQSLPNVKIIPVVPVQNRYRYISNQWRHAKP